MSVKVMNTKESPIKTVRAALELLIGSSRAECCLKWPLDGSLPYVKRDFYGGHYDAWYAGEEHFVARDIAERLRDLRLVQGKKKWGYTDERECVITDAGYAWHDRLLKEEANRKFFVTSDTHFAHKNIIQYCSRPFDSVEAMDAYIKHRWNSLVSTDDVVLHVGDVTLTRRPNQNPDCCDFLKSLNGRVVLVYGNHDSKQMRTFYERELGWIVIKEIRVGNLIVRHHPFMTVPDGCDLVIHGHSHGTVKKEKHVDVGVDAQPDFSPQLLCSLVPEYAQALEIELRKILRDA